MKRLSVSPKDFMNWTWMQIEPFYTELIDSPINSENQSGWLQQWSLLASLIYETKQRHYVAITTNTNDLQAEQKYSAFLDEIFTPSEMADQKLRRKLLKSGLQPEGFAIPLRNIRAEVEIFNQENLPLITSEFKFSARYDQLIGEQTAEWDGEEVTLLHLHEILRDVDRSKRENAWRLSARRWLEDQEAMNELWVNLLDVRVRLASNSGLPDYRTYRWKQLHRFDYTPQDCKKFHKTIEAIVVPAARYLYEKRRQKLGIDLLRPWDLNVDPLGRSPLRPFESINELKEGVGRIFHQVDPQLGQYFEIMRRENLLDLENRKGKAPGGYCTEFFVSNRPFILMNAVNSHEDVQTLLHEGGHAFHVFEIGDLPYFHQKKIGLEFMEVASTSMELLGAPYLTVDQGGFYSQEDAARARIEFLEETILFWPYMAVVDAFQHWVYENPRQATISTNCDAMWGELWNRFMVGCDWSELNTERITGWQRKLHIFQDPFYYIEYGLAQLGAFQIWRNALKDQRAAVNAYRRALKLGGTVPLPQLYATAGAKFAFDPETVQQAVDLGIRMIEDLESKADADL